MSKLHLDLITHKAELLNITVSDLIRKIVTGEEPPITLDPKYEVLN